MDPTATPLQEPPAATKAARASSQALDAPPLDALRRSEERFRKIFEHSADAILVLDPARGHFVDANQRACRALGYGYDELMATPIRAIHPNEMPAFRRFAFSVLEQGSGWSDEFTCTTKSGGTLASEISAVGVDMDGQTVVIAMVRDITERKQAELALRRYADGLEGMVAERTAELDSAKDRQQALLQINNAIVNNLTREALFSAVATALRGVLSFDCASLVGFDGGGDLSMLHAFAGAPSPRLFPVGAKVPAKDSRVRWVLEHAQPLCVADLAEEVDDRVESKLVEEGIRAALVVPLLSKRGAIGALCLGSGTPGLYSAADAEFVTEVGRQVALAVENMQAYEEIARLKEHLEEENLYLQEELKTTHTLPDIVGQSRAMRQVASAVETVAPTDASVLITGETGTGKELVARAVHNLSTRRHKSMVTVNCAALPSGLIESELFGHERGAFTGALTRRLGRFELAHGGTIFLDEIGDLPLELQAKLLRVLQEGTFERVGATQTIAADVRVIAATNHALDTAVRDGRFRADLYYRLNVFPIALPPLRDRPEDVPGLVRHLVMKSCAKSGKRIDSVPQPAIDALRTYAWPGNVRELENVIERAVILSKGRQLALGQWLVTPRTTTPQGTEITSLAEMERRYILEVLDITGWRVSGPRGAAEVLDMKSTTLDARMKKLGILRPGRPSHIS